MIDKVYIVSDDLMDQLSIINQLQGIPYTVLMDVKTLEGKLSNFQNSFFLVNLHQLNIVALDFILELISIIPGIQDNIIAYTLEKHDHETIHAVKSKGIKLVFDNDQLKKFLAFLPRQ